MPLRDTEYAVELEDPYSSASWYVLAGRRYGPFGTAAEREIDLTGRIRRWHAAAKARGGWVHRRDYVTIVVTLPADEPGERDGGV